METLNFEIDVQFDEAMKCASEMNSEIIKMKNILNDLEYRISAMTWSGSRAAEFKDVVKKAKEELDIVYSNYIVHIPTKIEESLGQYKKYEN